jgi:hypothetical protein
MMMMMMTMMISMGWDCVSELWPPMGILFITQVIYKHGEPWWNDIDKVNFWFVHQSSGNPTSSHLVANQDELAKGHD